MVKKKSAKRTQKNEDTKLFAFLAILFLIVGFVIALLVKRNDKYVIFYAKQGLVLFIGFMGALVINIIPILGQIISVLMYIVLIVLWLIALINSVSGKLIETPLIGKYAKEINI